MVGQQILDLPIGVRVPVSQPFPGALALGSRLYALNGGKLGLRLILKNTLP